MAARIVVLASGSGTNAEALMRACATGALQADVVAVVTNKADAGVIERAAGFDVPAVVVEHRGRTPGERADADRRLVATIREFGPDLVVLAGWMRILGASVGAAFPIINLHPALPGAFAGVDAIRRAHEAFAAGEIDHSGVMIHWVPDEGVDVGPVVIDEVVPMQAGEILDAFERRMHDTEHRLIVAGTALALKEISG